MNEIDSFKSKYNYKKIDEYLIKSIEILSIEDRLIFWNDLLNQYTEDKTNLINSNPANALIIQFSVELKYKNENPLSADFYQICNQQIEKCKKKVITANQFDIDVWMEWMANNFDSAKKDYPEMMEMFKEALQENPLAISVKIEQIPDLFVKWKNEIENCLETTRLKKINTYLELIQGLLYHFKFPDEYNKASVEKIRPELLEMEAYFTNLLTKGTKKQKIMTSYVWLNNPEKELPELYRLMINKYKLIAPETTYEQFEAVFKGQPIESINPIKWHQDNASELLYFINKLEQTDNIDHNPKRADYQKLIACFVNPDGKQFEANLKQIKQNIIINLSQDKQKAINELVNNF